jgi:DUF4097 and DUF4098 domain-containing protein YvlB
MRRSFTGPLLMILIGVLFLWRTMHPEMPVFDILAQYWPFILIAWGLIRLLEIMIWHRDGVRGSFSGGEIVLIVLLCIVGSGIWTAREHHLNWWFRDVSFWGQQFDYPISATHSAAGMKRIVFDNARGSIKVIGSDATDVTISGHKQIRSYSKPKADHTDSITPVEIVPQGDRLLIRTNQDRVPNDQRIYDDLEVTVPRGVAVESRATSGDHEISDVTGDIEVSSSRADVRLARIGGNVRLDVNRSELIRAIDVKGRFEVQGRGSDLELENIAGQVTIRGDFSGTQDFKNLAKPLQLEGSHSTELSVQAVPGRISMDLGEFNAKDVVGPLRLITRSRDIKMDQFTNAVELETQRGDIELVPGKTPLAHIEARSGNGKIELLLPEKAAFDLDATAERGDAVNDYGPAITKETDRHSATLKGRVGDGPTIKMTASRGWISVRKEGTLPSEALPESRGPGMPKPPALPRLPQMHTRPGELRQNEVKM